MKDRDSGEVCAEVIRNTHGETLKGFVREHVEPGAALYTDEAKAYKGIPEFEHEAVNHSVGEYVDGMAHTSGIKSFWSHAEARSSGHLP